MFNIKNDICKSVILITGICSIYHLSKLAIENNYEPEFHYKDCLNISVQQSHADHC